jgi:UDPglucose--hexose-1-phosphate uridylyltransferase
MSPQRVHDEPPPEVRIDQLTGLRTVLAPARSERPIEFGYERPARKEGECPFCEGHEDETPPELWADRPEASAPDGPGWRVRVIPNLYPALSEPSGDGAPEGESGAGGSEARRPPEGSEGGETGISASADPLRAAARGAEPDLFRSTAAERSHEVIVHSPEHRISLGELGDQELAAALAGWRTRMREHSEVAAYVQLIVNEGRDAGASLEHSHAQLYALGFVPAAIARERERFTAYHERTMGGDLLAEIASEEVRRGERLVAIDEEAMLICPWASRSPFELRIVPRGGAASFADDDAGASTLRTALRALAARFGEVPQLNLWVITAPRGVEQFSWHLDLAPRFAIRAGFEMSTGVELNVFPPERAAAELREALG